MKKIIALSFLTLLISSCSTDSIKQKINKAGDVVGQTTGEFIEGAADGVQKAFDVKISLPKGLKEKGVEFGKSTISNDSIGKDNLLEVYVIFNKDYKGKLTAKVYDDNSLEMGRATVQLNGKMDETKYVAFHFDKRVNIDSKNKITVE
ncbi:MAG: hypothetical protein EBQ94_00480 [Flavobacteriales bacterium]|jgi:hypothetical protein|nr:hypothetical protein [Flavobacteriales bacterium]